MLKRLIRQCLLLLGIYQASRLLFYGINYPYFSTLSLTRYVELAFYGLRFDLSTIFALNLPYIVLCLLPIAWLHQHKIYSTACRVLFLGVNLLALLFELSDIAYFPYVRKRMTADVFDLIGNKADFIDLLPSYLRTFWFVPLLVFVFAYLFFKVDKKVSRYQEVHQGNSSFIKGFSHWILVVALSILCIRGGWQLKPIINANARLVASNEESPLVVNTVFSLLHSVGQNELKPLQYFSEKELAAYHNPVRQYAHNLPFRKMNVVMILLESFGKGFTGIGGRTSYTPFLDSLMGKGFVFTQAFANAHRSADGIPACVAGIPTCMNEPFMSSAYAGNAIESLPSSLKKMGYVSSFYHGGTNGTMGFDIFSQSAGFDQYIGRTEYAHDEDYDGTWGIWDEPFLQFVAKSLGKEKRPFFSTVFTLSSHEPFHLPKAYEHQEMGRLKGIYRGIAYSDHALQAFFETASKTDWYQNTLFVITADHNFLAYHDPLQYYNAGLGLYAIPVIFYAPGDTQLKGEYRQHFQQIDIMPSVLDYLHFPYPFFAFGQSAFDQHAHRFVYTQMDGHSQLLWNHYVVTADDTLVNGLFDFSKDSLMQHHIHNDSIKHLLVPAWKAFTQRVNNAFVENKQTLNHFLLK